MVANITVILMALAVGGVVLTRYVESSRAPRMVATGDHLAELPGLDWSQHSRTLLLVLNTGCHFCQDSVPFYQKLAQTERPDRDGLQIVAVFPNEAEMVRQFTSHEGLTMRSVPGEHQRSAGLWIAKDQQLCRRHFNPSLFRLPAVVHESKQFYSLG